MDDKQRAIEKYINEKKELQNIVLQIIEKSGNNDADFQNLINFLNSHQYEGNKQEMEHFLRLISNISNNHYRQRDFFGKIEKILTISSKFYLPLFSNEELFVIFQQSKPILLSLLKTKIITIDEIIFKYLLNFSEQKENEKYYYFYPELYAVIQSGTIDTINAEYYEITMNIDIEKFEKNRQKFENEKRICSLIREDSVEEFIQYVHQNNISLSSQIKGSLFETNSIFIEKDPTIIEYATFFGSIQIFKYLELNGVQLDPSLWLYAVHSNNSEMIQILEGKQIEMDDRTFSEAVKCHHNEISNYILQNLPSISGSINDLDENTILSVYSSDNYEFFTNEIDGDSIFFSLCKNGYYELVNLYLSLKKEEIENYISQNKESKISLKNFKIEDLLKKALENNKLDVVYHLLSELKCIPKDCFKWDEEIRKIAIPPTIESISEGAFSRCSELTQISIPNSVTSIEDSVFFDCISLHQITIPLSVKSLGSKCFYQSSIEEISIPSKLTSLGEYVFVDCEKLKRVSIYSPLTLINRGVFQNCQSLKEILIPPSVTLLGISAFFQCNSLTKIKIPSSVTSMKEYAIYNCSSLKEISIPSSVSLIDNAFLVDCLSVNKVTIVQCKEKRVDYLDDKFLVFKSNPENDVYDTLLWTRPTSDTAIIPSFIKTIKYGAFIRCKSLKSITIPSSVTSIGCSCFYFCSSLKEVLFESPSSVTSIGQFAFGECSSLTQITFPSSVTSIGESAFHGCSSLTQVTIPSSLTEFGSFIFCKCYSLKQVTMPSSINPKDLYIQANVKILNND